jgi:hypothetical protein
VAADNDPYPNPNDRGNAMSDVNRRRVLKTTAGAGLLAALGAGAEGAQEKGKEAKEKPPANDRDCVLAAGMTEAEADCWEAVAEAAGKFFALPEMHPMDKQEVATAIHVVQNKLLSRPTYRTYLENVRKIPVEKGKS